MQTITVAFTDAQGVTHSDAVFEVMYGYKGVTTTEIIGTAANTQQVVTVNYQFHFWHSQATKLAGLQPNVLVNALGQNVFTTEVTDPNSIISLEDFCLNQLQTVVLPSIDPNVVILPE